MGMYIMSYAESALKHIATYPDHKHPVMEVLIGDESFVVEKRNIVSFVQELISALLIDRDLADHIAVEYFQLFADHELVFPIRKDVISTPFSYISNENHNNDDEMISATINSMESLPDVAHRECIDIVNDRSLSKGQLQSSTYPQMFFAPGTSNEKLLTTENKIETHKIDEILCTFSKNQNKILLSIDCDACDRESIEISEQDKDKILSCQSLACLITTLKGMKGGEWVANSIEALIPSVDDEESNKLRFN